MTDYQFHPEAEKEHLETIAYYETQLPGLGASYLSEFESAMEQVCESPTRYRIEMKPDIRRITLKRFPFTVLYRKSKQLCSTLFVKHIRPKR